MDKLKFTSSYIYELVFLTPANKSPYIVNGALKNKPVKLELRRYFF